MHRIKPIPQYDWGIQKGDYTYPSDSFAVSYAEFSRRRKLIRKAFNTTLVAITILAFILLIITIS